MSACIRQLSRDNNKKQQPLETSLLAWPRLRTEDGSAPVRVRAVWAPAAVSHRFVCRFALHLVDRLFSRTTLFVPGGASCMKRVSACVRMHAVLVSTPPRPSHLIAYLRTRFETDWASSALLSLPPSTRLHYEIWRLRDSRAVSPEFNKRTW